MRLLFLGLFCLVLTGCTAAIRLPSEQATLAVVGGLIVDPLSSKPPAPGTVLISGRRILAVVPGEHRVPGAQLIDARGQYVVPGLWDMHAHIATSQSVGRAPENYVAHGVLAIRDMGGHLELLKSLRREIDLGERVGPSMVIAGPTLNGEAAAPYHRLVRSHAEARAAVLELSAAGVDFIKIHRRTGIEAFRAIAEETRRLGMKLSGHVPLGLRWPEASAAGMHSIEHIQTLLENEAGPSKDPVAGTFQTMTLIEGSRGNEIYDALARNGTFFTPTLVFFERTWEQDPPERRKLKQSLYARLRPQVSRAARSGVKLLAGTDLLDRYGQTLLDELERLVGAGLSTREALAAATVHARMAAGRGPSIIRAGEEASLLLVGANPLSDIRNLRRLDRIIIRGQLIEGSQLQALRR